MKVHQDVRMDRELGPTLSPDFTQISAGTGFYWGQTMRELSDDTPAAAAVQN